MEVLSKLLQNLYIKGKVKGIQMVRGCPYISHLLFADDILIFSQSKESECQEILNALEKFQAWSGLTINKRKSSLSFNANVSPSSKGHLCSLTRLQQAVGNNKYLGLPLSMNKSKKAQFDELIEGVKNKVQGWKAKTLSQPARVTLIKSVASSRQPFLPTQCPQ